MDVPVSGGGLLTIRFGSALLMESTVRLITSQAPGCLRRGIRRMKSLYEQTEQQHIRRVWTQAKAYLSTPENEEPKLLTAPGGAAVMSDEGETWYVIGFERLVIKDNELEPCKGKFPDIEVDGVRQPDDWEECDGDEAGTTEIKTEHYTADFQACFSETLGRWKAKLTSVDAKVKYGLCPGSAEDQGLVMITGPADPKITENSYCAINEKIKTTIKSNEEGGTPEIFYPTATLAHERKHVEQIRDKIDMHIIGKGGLYESLESEAYTLEKDKAANASKARDMLQSYFDYLWNNAKYDIHEELKEIAEDNSWEGDARKAAVPHLEALLQQIRDRADRLSWKPCSE